MDEDEMNHFPSIFLDKTLKLFNFYWERFRTNRFFHPNFSVVKQEKKTLCHLNFFLKLNDIFERSQSYKNELYPLVIIVLIIVIASDHSVCGITSLVSEETASKKRGQTNGYIILSRLLL